MKAYAVVYTIIIIIFRGIKRNGITILPSTLKRKLNERINYINNLENPNSNGKRRTKRMIALIMNIYAEEWYLRYDSLITPTNIDNEMMSPERGSLLLTIKHFFYEKIDSPPVSKRNSLITLKEYKRIPVQSLKQ